MTRKTIYGISAPVMLPSSTQVVPIVESTRTIEGPHNLLTTSSFAHDTFPARPVDLILRNKADSLERRLPDFVLHPYSLMADERGSKPVIGHIDYTCSWLALQSWKYELTKDCEEAKLAKEILLSVQEMGKLNNSSGYLPLKVSFDRNMQQLKIKEPRTRANTLTQLIFAYQEAYRTFSEFPEIKQLIRDHTKQIICHLLKNSFRMMMPNGVDPKHSDLSAKRILINPGRFLDALMIIEFGLNILDPKDDSFLAQSLKDWRTKLIGSYQKPKLIAGYLIQNKHTFKLGPVEYPSMSSNWLSALRLYSLVRLSQDNPEAHSFYAKAFDNFMSQTKDKNNTFFDLLFAKANPTRTDCVNEIIYLAENQLLTFPTELVPERAKKEESFEKKMVVRKFRIVETKVAIGRIDQRPWSPYEWKFDPLRIQPTHNKSPGTRATGLDYLMAYYLLENIKNKQ